MAELRRQVDAAAELAAERAAPEQVAAAVALLNEATSPLLRLLAGHDIGGHVRAAALGSLSVLDLWRLRRVCRAFARWCGAELARMPHVVCIGGFRKAASLSLERWAAGAPSTSPAIWRGAREAEAIDLATLRWGLLPPPVLH
jgi:hypothetical protein